MAEINEEWIPSPHFTPGPREIKYIVIHTTEGGLNGAITHLKNVGSSYHCLASLDGSRLVRLVRDEDVAYHCGTYAGVNKIGIWGTRQEDNENKYSLGISMEGFAKNEKPQAQLDLVLAKTKEWVERYKVPIDRSHIVGHYQIATDRSDPGASFPWDWLMAELRGEDPDVIQLNGKTLGHGFLNFFKARGGIDIFGLPISEEHFDPTLGCVVQWFERARMEYHPDNPENYRVQLGLLGNELFGRYLY